MVTMLPLEQVKLWTFLIVSSFVHIRSHGYRSSCKHGLDVSNPSSGVKIERINGSRVEYDPLPDSKAFYLGTVLSAEFRTKSSSGLLFALLDDTFGDTVITFLLRGHLVFTRQCGNNNALQVFRTRVNDGRWHHMRYMHTYKGGDLVIDGESQFRQYHMGPCANFRSVFFGGLPPDIGPVYWNSAKRSFNGCIKDIQLNGQHIAEPRYYAVSTCER